MKKILWIAPRWPEPANDGAKIATLELLKPIQFEKNFQVTLLALLPHEEPAPEISGIKFHEIRILRRHLPTDSHLVRMLKNPFLPITFGSFIDPDLQAEVKKIIFAGGWDAVVFDGVHAAIPLIHSEFPTKMKLFYRAHNVEYRLWERAADVSSWFKKQALLLQAKLVKRFERKLVRHCAMTFAVSEDDAEFFKRWVMHDRVEVIRIGQNFSKVDPVRESSPANKIVLGFIGRIDWMPNQQGLDWFLREVWPKVIAENLPIELQIAGSGNWGWLDSHRHLSKIKFLGKVESTETFYREIDVSIVPLFVGSGTRVKVIESSRYAVACLSTALGVEGCGLQPGESYLAARNRDEWVATLKAMTHAQLKHIGLNAFRMMKKDYDSTEISHHFNCCLAKSLNA